MLPILSCSALLCSALLCSALPYLELLFLFSSPRFLAMRTRTRALLLSHAPCKSESEAMSQS
ncbi:hypothetical protein BU24DRAFT_427481 [Aaosphaeria arxii CBS 175.79]|uniref:Uncharacterized protein n=1 Tax=Aaosphaeria arxii CBS 175.79 TaxID=1450172 RepID=A0A6A5XBQ2_9PLEO|nr:uncharacterized protein BU24DRAFT_427481 [Aaosphaeria arxii CBS 175.79]KAF2010350.1 hypothetical protein BU24DRAFT_427481 [Aaosphaeria arxii CBS 175.79]